MADTPPASRCGIDTVELARMERFLAATNPEDLGRLFSQQELEDAGDGPGRLPSLAARFAAKEACCKLFPRETALGRIGPADFAVVRDQYGQPTITPSVEGRAVMDLHRVECIRVSLTHTASTASAMTLAIPRQTDAPWFGRWLYHLLPYRRGVVLSNLRQVFGQTLPESEILLLAKAYYAHFARFLIEFIRLPFMSEKRRRAWTRVENIEAPIRAWRKDRGLLLLTGHFGNWEVATVAAIHAFPQYRGLFHFVRRPLKPAWFEAFVNWRFRRAGFGSIPKRGSLDAILQLLQQGAIVVYVLDQHADRKLGVMVDFFGRPAGTFKSLALLALSTGAPIIPAATWREPDGSHVLRFEDPLPVVDCEDSAEAIRRTTRACNAALEKMLLRHPEQWIWMHKRWKARGGTPAPAKRPL